MWQFCFIPFTSHLELVVAESIALKWRIHSPEMDRGMLWHLPYRLEMDFAQCYRKLAHKLSDLL